MWCVAGLIWILVLSSQTHPTQPSRNWPAAHTESIALNTRQFLASSMDDPMDCICWNPSVSVLYGSILDMWCVAGLICEFQYGYFWVIGEILLVFPNFRQSPIVQIFLENFRWILVIEAMVGISKKCTEICVSWIPDLFTSKLPSKLEGLLQISAKCHSCLWVCCLEFGWSLRISAKFQGTFLPGRNQYIYFLVKLQSF